MPKDRRSGKQIRKGYRYDDYDTIGTANNGTIDVIKAKNPINKGVPLYSNGKNTIYFIAKDLGNKTQITNIAIYKGRNIVENIDIDAVKGNHYHKWKTSTVRGKTKQVRYGHYYRLSPKHTTLIVAAQKWNLGD